MTMPMGPVSGSRRGLCGIAGICLVAVSACGRESRSNPSAPDASAPPPISASLFPVPVRAQRRVSGVAAGSQRYEVRAELAFRNDKAVGARITQVQLAAVQSAGVGEVRVETVDLTLPPNGSVTHSVVETVEVPAGTALVAWRLSATGVDDNKRPFEVTAVEVPIIIDADAPTGPDETLVAAGDIALCDTTGHEATARLLEGLPGTIAGLGDYAYPTGTTERFVNCYDRGWGRQRYRTRPAPGNHEWEQNNGGPYFSYFGALAGPSGLGYYSYDLGTWHILSLNSNVPAGEGSAQLEWVRADLATHPSACTLAYWHHPVFSSGPNGNNGQMTDVWRVLDAADADVVLNGHDHMYERFAPQDASGRPNPRGVRAFTAGTGGGNLYALASLQPNSEVRDSRTWGVLKLTLKAGTYDWEFIPIATQSFRDSGSAKCVTASTP